MAHRVVSMGTGNTGVHALRGVIEHPELDLAGQLEVAFELHQITQPGAHVILRFGEGVQLGNVGVDHLSWK